MVSFRSTTTKGATHVHQLDPTTYSADPRDRNTTAQLNTGFRSARKALITAQIDAALEDGDIDADEAAEAKADLADADLPGYKQSRFGFHGGFGGGRGHHGP